MEDISNNDEPILSAVKALKMFSMLIRGFAKRERKHIVEFLANYGGANESGKCMINEWLQKLKRLYIQHHKWALMSLVILDTKLKWTHTASVIP